MNEIVKKSSPEYVKAVKEKNRTAVMSKTRAELHRKLLYYGLAALLSAVLIVGNYFISDITSDWYAELVRPFFCPPLPALLAAYAVAIVLFGVTYALVLTRYQGMIIKFEFLFNALLQVLWTIFFFRIRAVFASIIILSLLVLHTFFLLKYTRQHIGNLAFLLLAHLLRVVFSLLLNYAILILN